MARKKRGQPVHGWFILDKPHGMTSTKAVGAVRALFDAQKAGHAGTLDPLASGMLPIALGEATKTVPFAMGGSKTYRFDVTWGAETETCDLEGAVTRQSDARPSVKDIDTMLADFRGEIRQVPPKYSAIKVDGERAYDLARDGEEFELKARSVQIERLERVGEAMPDKSTFEIDCGKGTYIRALARDFGRALGCFGHVSQLRRLAVKPFCESDMIVLEILRDLVHKGADRADLLALLKPVNAALDDIPAVIVDQADASDLRQGRTVLMRGRDAPVSSDLVYVSSRGLPVALARIEKGCLKPKRVFVLG